MLTSFMPSHFIIDDTTKRHLLEKHLPFDFSPFLCFFAKKSYIRPIKRYDYGTNRFLQNTDCAVESPTGNASSRKEGEQDNPPSSNSKHASQHASLSTPNVSHSNGHLRQPHCPPQVANRHPSSLHGPREGEQQMKGLDRCPFKHIRDIGFMFCFF